MRLKGSPLKYPLALLVLLTVGALLGSSLVPASAQQPDDESVVETDVTKGGLGIRTKVLQQTPAPDGRPTRSGSLIVTFKDGTSDQQKSAVHRAAGATFSEKLLLANTERVQVSPPRANAVAAIYAGRPEVESVEFDLIATTQDTPNDPSFSQQWGMTKVGAPTAWNTTKGATSTRIAVLDCGIFEPGSSTFKAPDGQVGHPDLRNSKVVSRANFSTSPNLDDYCNHGTHVAGIAAANTNNGVGVAGLGRDVKLVNVKVLGDNGSGSFSGIINGILWAAGCTSSGSCGGPRAEVINMSLGASGSCSDLPSLQAAINIAWQQGLVVVAAAGNNNSSGSFIPASCDNVVSVSASTSGDARASFSNYGSTVDVAAPGESIYSTNYVGGYASFNGTSMASPHVAGLAALLRSMSAYPSNSSAVNRIFTTAKKSSLAGSVQGRIDAAAAVGASALAATPTATPTPTATATRTSTPIAATAPNTAVPGTPTNTPTSTPVTPTNTPTNTATHTPTNTPTSTPTPPPAPVLRDTGFQNCGANSKTNGGDNNGYEVNPANACADDTLFASDINSGSSTEYACDSRRKDRHMFYNYGFDIPGGAVIQGIEVRLDAWVDNTEGNPRLCVELSGDGGRTWTTATRQTATNLGTGQETYTIGSTNDMWGVQWAAGSFTNKNFRVRITSIAMDINRDFSLDWVAVNIHYLTP